MDVIGFQIDLHVLLESSFLLRPLCTPSPRNEGEAQGEITFIGPTPSVKTCITD
jgi:hypothetical protein